MAVVGAGSLMAAGSFATTALAAQPTSCGPSPAVTPFIDNVQQPPVAAPDRRHQRGLGGHDDDRLRYTLTVDVHNTHKFSSAWGPTRTLGYSTANATVDYLGPTIVTREGRPIKVRVVNNLPAAGTPVFPFDQPNNNNTITTHRHGGLQPVKSDGVPAPNGVEVPPGGSQTNHYPNDQAAAPLWYHDHADAMDSYHVYEGLAGLAPNTDKRERSFGLPRGDFAKSYVLQDKSFNADYSLCYTHADPEFFGDLPVINGTIAPKQNVEPRRYTFTLVNGSDSRFYHLSLQQVGGAPSGPPAMTVVGNDEGYLLHPAPVRDLLIAPGERYRVVVDFTGHNSQKWVLANDAPAPYPGPNAAPLIPRLMRFDVGPHVTSPDHSRVPKKIRETNNTEPLARTLREARLRTVQAGENTPGVPQIGDKKQLLNYFDPPTEKPQLGSTEVWAMRNHSPDAHPFHEHIVELRLVGRWHVGQWDANGRPVPGTIGPFEPAAAYESGPKDTFVSPPDFITAWVGTYTIPGTSVWHCHILSHEDGASTGGAIEMMRPLAVGKKPQRQLPYVATLRRLDTLVRKL
ncbi:multicopper oxidase family protein [Streptomyces yaanensis]|uniref:Multicopper oxidase family protein n=1 Tax=Streptomyces yaanensis TaxID=1142239 RepID=A0ABV7SAU1_9ACTN|nr:multicopper oxidase domain-containing protein [Streptomyces sp. CGMCC 4.7035]WNC02860.1 multicopper oxidase domain-containing protein [Streptomyces sp. CGMCC 4.7035]